MNDAPTVVAGLSDDDHTTLVQLWKQLKATESRNLLRQLFYERKRFPKPRSPVIPAGYYRLGLTLGWSAKSVDMVDNRTGLLSFSWSDGDLESLGSDAAFLDNEMRQTFALASKSSLIHGPAFSIVTKGGAGEPEAILSVKDALDCTGLWNSRTRDLDAGLSITSRDDENNPNAFVLYFFNRTVRCRKVLGRWGVEDESSHYLGVPVDLLPYRPLLNSPFGFSRITRAAMGLQDAAIRSLIRMEGNADAYALPQLWLFGPNEDDIKESDGTADAMRNLIGRLRAVPDDQELADDGNTLARAAIEQIAASSPQPNIEHLRELANGFAGEVNVPSIYLGYDDKANPTSADALFIQDLPLIEEAESATDNWTPGLSRSWRKLLQCQNGLSEIPESWRSIRPKFQPAAYVSRAAAADAGTKIAAAIPGFADTEVGLEMMGLSQDQIDRFKAEQRRNRGAGVLDALRQAQASNQPLTAPEAPQNGVVGG